MKLTAQTLMIVVLAGCGRVPDNAVTAYQWHKQAEPATTIIINEYATESVASRCPQAEHAGACATVGGPLCQIDFVATWSKDWKLLEHELRHCLGYNHP